MVVIMSGSWRVVRRADGYRHNAQLYDDQMRVPMICYVPDQAPREIFDYVTTVDLGSTILKLVGIDCPRSTPESAWCR